MEETKGSSRGSKVKASKVKVSKVKVNRAIRAKTKAEVEVTVTTKIADSTGGQARMITRPGVRGYR